MKHFANCTPDEFMAQIVKFRTPFVNWLETIGFAEIRARRPEGFDAMDDDQKAEALKEIAADNTADIIMSAMEKDPAGTRRVMALSCFTDERDFNTHTMVEYISAILAMFYSPEVRSFFTLFLGPTLRRSLKP